MIDREVHTRAYVNPLWTYPSVEYPGRIQISISANVGTTVKERHCLDATYFFMIELNPVCNEARRAQQWFWDPTSKVILNANRNLCLAVLREGSDHDRVGHFQCNEGDLMMKWNLDAGASGEGNRLVSFYDSKNVV
jgi:hypothetical protein